MYYKEREREMKVVFIFVALFVVVVYYYLIPNEERFLKSPRDSPFGFFTSEDDCLSRKCLADPKYLCMQYCAEVGYFLREDESREK